MIACRFLLPLVLATALAPAALAREAPRSALPEKPASILVAQRDERMPTCEKENRRVPVGTTYCNAGQVWRCEPNGQWSNTGKPC